MPGRLCFSSCLGGGGGFTRGSTVVIIHIDSTAVGCSSFVLIITLLVCLTSLSYSGKQVQPVCLDCKV